MNTSDENIIPLADPSLSERTRLGAEQRRFLLVQAAYALIVEKGILGVRIRDVAEHAGIHHATVLYHFPTKEALMSAVIAHVGTLFLTTQAPEYPLPPDAPLADRLHRYFVNLDYQLRSHPELFVVIDELFLHGQRDPALRSLLQAERAWETYLTHLLTAGGEQTNQTKRLPITLLVQAIMTFCKGLPLQTFASADERTQLIDLFEQWIRAALLLVAPTDGELHGGY